MTTHPMSQSQNAKIAAEVSIRIILGQRCQRILQPVNKAVILIFDIFYSCNWHDTHQRVRDPNFIRI